jgi:hypothetical protein
MQIKFDFTNAFNFLSSSPKIWHYSKRRLSMISYKDMTFCELHKMCEDGETCHRALTDEVKKDADKWWGGVSAPLAIADFKDVCFKGKFFYNPENENDNL